MKVLKNLILLSIVVFCISTLPIFMSPMDFSGMIDIDDVEENTTISLNSVAGTELTSPSIINLLIETNSSEEVYLSSEEIIKARLYKNGNFVKSVDLDFNYSKAYLNSEEPIEVSVNISRETLALPYGNYELIFEINEDNLSDTVNVLVDYPFTGNYYTGTNENQELTGIKLYFQTKDLDLVPIYRFVEAGGYMLHNVLEAELLKGPVDENLISPIGEVNYIIYRDNIVFIDLPYSEEKYTGEGSENAYYSFLKTFSQVPNADRIRFIFDDNIEETWFNGINVVTRIYFPDNINAYIPVLVGERFYLSEKNILLEEDTTAEEKVHSIFDYIKNNSSYFEVLNSISIENANIEESVVYIDFSNGFSDLFSGEKEIRNMLIDSLVYSFTSIENITGVKITEDGNELSEFGDYDLSQIIQPYNYFNLESIEN